MGERALVKSTDQFDATTLEVRGRVDLNEVMKGQRCEDVGRAF